MEWFAGHYLADAGHGLETRGVAGGDGAQELPRRPSAQDRQRDLRAHGLHAEQQQEQVALLLAGKAVERDRVVAQDGVRVQRDLAPDARHVAQRLGGDGQPVADPTGHDHHVVGTADRHLAFDERDHAASTTWFAWQMATARASAAWSGRGASGSESSAWTIRPTWSLSARPVPHTAALTCWGV